MSISPLRRLFQQGLGLWRKNRSLPPPYSWFGTTASLLATMGLCYWIHSFRTHQYQNDCPNPFIPSIVYKVRRQSFIFWETCRHANGLKGTWTYSVKGQQSNSSIPLYSISPDGSQHPIILASSLQNLKHPTPLYQHNFPPNPQVNAKITYYMDNLNNPYQLDNYLRCRPINMGDWFRAGWYLIYRVLHLTNRWRYDEYWKKDSAAYAWEQLRYYYIVTGDREGFSQKFKAMHTQIGLYELWKRIVLPAFIAINTNNLENSQPTHN